VAAEAAVALAKSTSGQIAARRAALAASRTSTRRRRPGPAGAGAIGLHPNSRPVDGIVDVRAALQGEVVNPGQGIVTLIDPGHLWVRADVEETYIDSIQLGDKLPVRLPSGAERTGTVFYRGMDADYATQRDVSRTKRDIKTFEIRLRCNNDDRALAVGMTAYVTAHRGQAMTMFAVEVENLTKRFGDFCAVDHLNFNVENGEIFGCSGPTARANRRSSAC
jgi:HlyD family secretion protein